MLADDPDGDVDALVGPVVLARQRLHLVEQRREQVGLEEAADVLQRDRDPLEARARVDVLRSAGHRRISACSSTCSCMKTWFQISM